MNENRISVLTTIAGGGTEVKPQRSKINYNPKGEQMKSGKKKGK
jgi:hypothetical protein